MNQSAKCYRSQPTEQKSIIKNVISDEVSAWIKLSLLTSLTWQQKLALIKVYKKPQHIFAEKSSVIVQYFANNHTSKTRTVSANIFDYPDNQYQEIMEFLAKRQDVSIIGYLTEYYPFLLTKIAKPPLLLYAIGDNHLLQKTSIAMVGSRHASYYGKEMAYDMAKQLAQQGVIITSGLAAGIDSVAHQGAIDGKAIGGTIAVLGCGIDVCYPRSNQLLYQDLAINGLILSEYHPDSKPLPYRFPQRNRIISGLSKGVLVIEASLKSGSLITAKMALQENRDVFALPGSVHSVHSKGCHYLIKHGAKLVENIDDILSEYSDLNIFHEANVSDENRVVSKNKLKESLTEDQGNVLNSIELQPTSIEKVLSRTQLQAQQVNVILLQLELMGYIEQDETQKYRRNNRLR